MTRKLSGAALACMLAFSAAVQADGTLSIIPSNAIGLFKIAPLDPNSTRLPGYVGGTLTATAGNFMFTYMGSLDPANGNEFDRFDRGCTAPVSLPNRLATQCP